jgi:hypothetical protein
VKLANRQSSENKIVKMTKIAKFAAPNCSEHWHGDWQ